MAKEQEVIKRQRCFSASSLLLVLVLGWLQHPRACPSQLARFAHTVGGRRKQTSHCGTLDRENRPLATVCLGICRLNHSFCLFSDSRALGSVSCGDSGGCLHCAATGCVGLSLERKWKKCFGLFSQAWGSMGHPLGSVTGTIAARWQGP